MKKIAIGLGVILALLLVALVTMPASVAWRLGKHHLPASGAISNVQGTLWHGNADLAATAPITFFWQVEPAPLLAGRLAADLRAQTSDSQVSAHVVQARGSLFVHSLSGTLGPTLLAPYQITLSEPITLENLRLTRSQTGFTNGEGGVRFGGGSVTYIENGVTKSTTSPPLAGTLSSEAGKLILSISGPNQPLARATLTGDGLLTLQLRREWFDVLGINWQGAPDAEGYVFEVQQDIF